MIANPGDADDAARPRCGSGVEVVELADRRLVVPRHRPDLRVRRRPTRIALDWHLQRVGREVRAVGPTTTPSPGRWAGRRRPPGAARAAGVRGRLDHRRRRRAPASPPRSACMHPNRNPALTQTEIEDQVCDALGLDAVIWLPLRLGARRRHRRPRRQRRRVRPARDAAAAGLRRPRRGRLGRACNVNRRGRRRAPPTPTGERIEVVEVPVLPFVERDGARVAVPYLNFYVGNGFVVVPTCGHPADDDMVAIIAEQFPGRDDVRPRRRRDPRRRRRRHPLHHPADPLPPDRPRVRNR